MDAATQNNGAPPPPNTLSFAHSVNAVANPQWLFPPEQAPQPPYDEVQHLLPYGRSVPCPWRIQMEDERRCDKDWLKEFKSTLAKMWATAWAAESEALTLFKEGRCWAK